VAGAIHNAVSQGRGKPAHAGEGEDSNQGVTLPWALSISNHLCSLGRIDVPLMGQEVWAIARGTQAGSSVPLDFNTYYVA